MFLHSDEIRILQVLRDDRVSGWMPPAAIATKLDLPAWKVRSYLQEMSRSWLVRRGSLKSVAPTWGMYEITNHGREQLAANEQLGLVS